MENRYVYPRDALEIIFEKRDAFFKAFMGLDILPYQQEVSDAMIRHFLDQDGWKIHVQISRQAWKSKVVFWTIAFMVTFCKDIIPEYWNWNKLNIGFCVPQFDQLTQNSLDLKEIFAKIEEETGFVQLVTANSTMIELSNGARIYLMSLHETSKNQSKTLHFVIADEAQEINYTKFKKEIEPMLTSTNGTQVFVWVWCYVDNYFYKATESTSTETYKHDVYKVIKQREYMYQLTWDGNLLKYKDFIDSLDKDTIEFKTEYMLISDIAIGQFVTPQQLFSLREEYMPIFDYDGPVYAWIDFAKSSDSTVLTLIDDNFKILNLFELKWDIMEQNDFLVWVCQDYNVRLIHCDETWLGAGSTSYLQRIFWKNKVIWINFTTQSKHLMYTNLQKQLRKIRYSSLFQNVHEKFEKQFLTLETKRDEKGMLHCAHVKWWHDDYPDSLALACMWVLSNPNVWSSFQDLSNFWDDEDDTLF